MKNCMKNKLLSLLLAVSLILSLTVIGASAEYVTASGSCGSNVTWTVDSSGTLTIQGTGAMEDYSYGYYEPDWLYWGPITKIVVEPGVTEIGDRAFCYLDEVTEVSIADTVTRIGESAFRLCESLETIQLPDSVTELGAAAFAWCESLKTVNIPSGVREIYGYTFGYCTSLENITIPDTVENVEWTAFIGCTNLTSALFLGMDTELEMGAFEDCPNVVLYGFLVDGYSYVWHTAWLDGLTFVEVQIVVTTPDDTEPPDTPGDTETPDAPDVAETTTVQLPFTDVASGAWYHDAVAYVYKSGLMNGVSGTTFEPQTNLTRAMFVTILGRMAGVDSSYPTASAGKFKDVTMNSWYGPYVAWAVEWGIVNGISDNEFGTQNEITREQMATIISRYVNNTGIELLTSASAVSGFKDSAQVSSYAKDGLELMRRTGIITGDQNGNFNPKNAATRAEAATMMMRLDQAIEETSDTDDGSGNTVTEVCQVTLVYDDDAGTQQGLYLAKGAALLEPTMTKTRAGYEFTGWYEDWLCTIPYDFSQPVTEDLILYGGWKRATTFTLTVYWPDNEVEYITVNRNTTVEDAVPAREISGKTFVGRFTSADYNLMYGSNYHIYENLSVYMMYRDAEPEVPTTRYTITVSGVSYTIGQDASELGVPDETLDSSYGFTWYVYGTSTYRDFFAAGVKDGKVVALVSSGLGFTYEGMTCGSQKVSFNVYSSAVVIATDYNDNNIVHGVMILGSDYWEDCPTRHDAAALAGESKMIFHLTNAFRVYHGVSPLTWSTQAAAAARLHSEDMAAQDYFAHDSIDGRTYIDRIKAQGISYSTAGENIAGGDLYNGFNAYAGWVDSSGHRTNMLKSTYTHLGVGGGYNGGWFFTQDFYR